MAKKEKEESNILNSKDQLRSILNDNKSENFNDIPDFTYLVSTGSILLDYKLSGGIGPGAHRFCGHSESGKTSCALSIMRNFLLSIPNSKGFYVKAEGKLSQEVKDRSGVRFTNSPEEWEVGTCFVYKGNIFESVFDAMRQLIRNNQEDIRYFFIVDSVDALCRRADFDKSFEEADQVAGGALITSVFLKKVSLAMESLGHIMVLVSQVRATVEVDRYSSAPKKAGNASGGFALEHYPNWVLDFTKRNKSSDILEKDGSPYDPQKNKILGHWAKVSVSKSTNESTHSTVTYPIKHGRSDGKSIWIEKEIVDMLFSFKRIESKGAWTYISADLIEDCKKDGIDIPEKFNGIAKLSEFLDSNPQITMYLSDKIKYLMCK